MEEGELVLSPDAENIQQSTPEENEVYALTGVGEAIPRSGEDEGENTEDDQLNIADDSVSDDMQQHEKLPEDDPEQLNNQYTEHDENDDAQQTAQLKIPDEGISGEIQQENNLSDSEETEVSIPQDGNNPDDMQQHEELPEDDPEQLNNQYTEHDENDDAQQTAQLEIPDEGISGKIQQEDNLSDSEETEVSIPQDGNNPDDMQQHEELPEDEPEQLNDQYTEVVRPNIPDDAISSDELTIQQDDNQLDEDGDNIGTATTDTGAAILDALQTDEPESAEVEEDQQQQATGMVVHDDYDGVIQSWEGPKSIPGQHSITHLPPLATNPDMDAESERLVQKFVKKGAIPEGEHRQQVLQYVQRQKVNAVCANKFIEAGKYQEIVQKLTVAIEEANAQDYANQKIEDLERKLQETNDELKNHETETEKLIKEETRKLADKRYQQEAQQEEELGAFEDKWNDEEYLAKFTKPSSDLLNLKKVERALVVAKDFEKAEQYRIQAEELEKTESESAQRRAEEEMKRQHQRILQRHESDRHSLQQYTEYALRMVRHEREVRLAALIARQAKLQGELETVKTSKVTSLPPLAAKPASRLSSAQDTMTPRTVHRFVAYKTNIKQPRLTVRPLGAISRAKKTRKCM